MCDMQVQSFHETIAVDVGSVASMTDLCDGVFLAKIMHQMYVLKVGVREKTAGMPRAFTRLIMCVCVCVCVFVCLFDGSDPEYLNMELINEQAAGNWALKASNLKTLLRGVELYYHEELGQLCEANELIDTHLIAKENDIHEVAKLAELILGCAVQCPNRSEYIHPIMQMDASEQASMMHLIENIMHRFQLTSPGGARSSPANSSFSYINHEGESSESLAFQLTHALEKVSSMELKMLDMEREKRELTERFENSIVEKQSWTNKCAALEDERDKLLSERQSTLTRDNKKIQQIVEGEIHALTLQLEEKNEELQRVKRESTERLMVLENEVRRQADELDISRSKLGQLAKLESSVSKYKKKLEEMNSLRNQVKDLEIHNAQYLDKVLDLESTVKTMPTLKALVERYKNQVVDLETANVEAVSNNQVKDQKIRRLQEELDNALGGKEFLESQVEELRSQLFSVQHNGHDEASSIGGGFSADVLLGRESGSSMREKIARLERENAQLKSGEENAQEAHLASELDMALKAKEALQFSLLQLKNENEELSEQLRLARQQGTAKAQQVAAGVQTASTLPSLQGEAHTGAVEASGVPAVAQGGSSVTGVPGLVRPAQFGVVEGVQSSHLIGSTGVVGALSHAPTADTVSSGITAAQVAVYEEKIQKLVSEAFVSDRQQQVLAFACAVVARFRSIGWENALEQIQMWVFSLLAFLIGILVHSVSVKQASVGA